MARPRNPVPSYLPHQATGRARIVWTDHHGKRREKLLPGAFGSKESKLAFAKCQQEALVGLETAKTVQDRLSIAEAALAYLQFAKGYYPIGSEARNIGLAIRPLTELFGFTMADEFGPKKLASVREKMIERGLTRQGTNAHVRRLVRFFKWLASEEKIPASVYESLKTLSGLRAGRCEAPESSPRQPVDEATYLATIAKMRGHAKALVQLLWLTGARPSELCGLTMGQMERSGDVWKYRPAVHKTAHKGKRRVILFGPKAQAILLAHLDKRGSIGPDDPVFSPTVDQQDRFAEMRAGRKSPVQPSQKDRSKRKPKKKPAEWYCPNAILQAIRRAARRAGVAPWFTYRIRHAYATTVRQNFDLEASQVLLGHSSAEITQIYAQRDEAKAVNVAKQIG